MTPVEYYYDAPKYFPENEFDTYTDTKLRDAGIFSNDVVPETLIETAFANLQYSMTAWFKVSRTMDTANSAIMLHLTALKYYFDSIMILNLVE